MAELNNPTPLPDDEDLLGDLSRLTGLFNPETIWHQEELLDDLTEADEAPAPAGPAPTAPAER